MIDASRELLAGAQVAPRILLADREVADFGGVSSRWYIRLEVDDSPGVLAAIAGVFGESGVSLGSVWQEGRGDEATLILITHDATEDAHQQAVKRLLALAVVKQVATTIRVLGTDQPPGLR